MSDRGPIDRATRRLAEEAAAWYLDMRDAPDERTRERFLAWLRHSPKHVAEYLAVADLHGDVRAAAAMQQAPTAMLRREARDEPSVVPLFDEARWPIETIARRSRSRRLYWAVAAMIFVAASTSLVWPMETPDVVRYAAEGDAVREVTLADRTILRISPGGIVDVAFDAHARRFILAAGRASFDVGRDPTRPLTVTVGEQQIEDVGTVFDVSREDAGSTITVISGKVAVWRSPPSWLDRAHRRLTGIPALRSLIADAQGGERILVADDGHLVARERVDDGEATAWLPADIRFRDASVAEVARRFNAYTARPLVVEGDALAHRRISGVFHAHDPEAFISYLDTLPDVRVVREAQRVRIIDHGDRRRL